MIPPSTKLGGPARGGAQEGKKDTTPAEHEQSDVRRESAASLHGLGKEVQERVADQGPHGERDHEDENDVAPQRPVQKSERADESQGADCENAQEDEDPGVDHGLARGTAVNTCFAFLIKKGPPPVIVAREVYRMYSTWNESRSRSERRRGGNVRIRSAEPSARRTVAHRPFGVGAW